MQEIAEIPTEKGHIRVYIIDPEDVKEIELVFPGRDCIYGVRFEANEKTGLE